MGHYDFVNIVEATHEGTVMKMSAEIGSSGFGSIFDPCGNAYQRVSRYFEMILDFGQDSADTTNRLSNVCFSSCAQYL